MKKIILFLLIAAFPVFFGCSEDDHIPFDPEVPLATVSMDEARKIAWDNLTPDMKAEVTHAWEDSQVREVAIQLCGPTPIPNPIRGCYEITLFTLQKNQSGRIEVLVEKAGGAIFSMNQFFDNEDNSD